VTPKPSRLEERDGVPSDIDRCLTQQGYQRKLKELGAEEESLKVAHAAGDRAAADAAQHRIDSLRRLLDEHRLLPRPSDPSMVSIGSIVSFREGEGEETWQIVPPLEADVDQSMISVTTPLGTALLGHRSGDLVSVASPGAAYEIEITGIELP
jgi:transcription elongation factor GreA